MSAMEALNALIQRYGYIVVSAAADDEIAVGQVIDDPISCRFMLRDHDIPGPFFVSSETTYEDACQMAVTLGRKPAPMLPGERYFRLVAE